MQTSKLVNGPKGVKDGCTMMKMVRTACMTCFSFCSQSYGNYDACWPGDPQLLFAPTGTHGTEASFNMQKIQSCLMAWVYAIL